ncbi:tyrosine-type recombinase/integrase [Oleiharenicola lentus]|uniref:tyrosine-type recombinase/integrase n=1 Tax=Oleiharenicola lentus TaxID=2508720 RepID=UPI003F673BCB
MRIALEHYLADAERRRIKNSLSEPQFQRIGYAMTELEKYFGSEEPLANFTTTRLHDYLKETTKGKDGGAFSNKTWMNRRGYLTAFFEFCIQERWIDKNPASAIRTYKKKSLSKAAPAVLTIQRAQTLMAFLESFKEGRLVPFYALCLFAGIRPDWDNGEISKLLPEHFDLVNRQLKLPAEITKTKRARLVQLQPNLVAWLKRFPLNKFPIICANFRKLHIGVRKQFALEHDVLRHTYCSMLVGKYRSVSDAALQAGNSEGVIWSNYLNLTPQKEAEKFWDIIPKKKR